MKKFFMSMVAAIVCGTAFAGNVNEVATSAVSDDDLRLYLLSMVQRLHLTQTILAREQLSESAEP